MAKIERHKRVNDILLGPLERPALKWLCARMPAWMTPDILTAIGFFGTLVTAAGYILCFIDRGFLWLASLGLVINWFGDSLDGNLARYRHIERPKYGYFVDHTIDAFSQVIIILGIGLSPYVQFEIACLGLIGYLLLGTVLFNRTHVTGVLVLSQSKLGPTEARALVILTNTLVFFTKNPHFKLPFTFYGIRTISLFDICTLILTFLLFYFAIRMTVIETIKLAKRGE